MLIIKVNCPFLYSSMKIFFVKIRLIFDIEKWLWKSEFCYIWPSIPNQAKYLEPFYGLVYSPLNSAKLSCSSEVTLTYRYELSHIISKKNDEEKDSTKIVEYSNLFQWRKFDLHTQMFSMEENSTHQKDFPW